MSEAIEKFAADVNAKFDDIDAAQAVVETATLGLADDVLFLKDKITQLENNPGPISPADQELLTAALNRANAGAVRANAAKDALKALDDATTRPTPPE